MTWAEEMPSAGEGIIHLNHCGIAPVTARGRDAMVRYAEEACSQPGIASPRWYAEIGKVRQRAARLLHCAADEIAFTKSTTHGLLIIANSINWEPGDVIVVEENCFPANWHAWKPLEERFGVKVVTWPERDHRYDPADLEKILSTRNVALVAVCAADFATGFRHDLNAVGRLVKDNGAMFCIDGIQAVGAVPVDVWADMADFLSADGHKWMLGPEGAGLLYVRTGILEELNESMTGWLGRKDFIQFERHDLPPDPTTRRFEEGALNLSGNLGLGGSLDLLTEAGEREVWERIQENTRVLREGLKDLGWRCMSPDDEPHMSGISAFETPGIDPMALASALKEEKIICTARRGFFRVAPHFYQTPEMMQTVVEKIAERAKG